MVVNSDFGFQNHNSGAVCQLELEASLSTASVSQRPGDQSRKEGKKERGIFTPQCKC